MVFAVTWDDAGQKTTFFVALDLYRQPSHAAEAGRGTWGRLGQAGWYVGNITAPFRPSGFDKEK